MDDVETASFQGQVLEALLKYLDDAMTTAHRCQFRRRLNKGETSIGDDLQNSENECAAMWTDSQQRKSACRIVLPTQKVHDRCADTAGGHGEAREYSGNHLSSGALTIRYVREMFCLSARWLGAATAERCFARRSTRAYGASLRLY